PRVVEEDVRPATCTHEGLGGPVDRRAVPYVHHRQRQGHPVRRAELGRQLLQTFGPPRPQDQIRPLAREPPSARLPDPRARSGDENQLPFYPSHPTPTSPRDAFARRLYSTSFLFIACFLCAPGNSGPAAATRTVRAVRALPLCGGSAAPFPYRKRRPLRRTHPTPKARSRRRSRSPSPRRGRRKR